ncbi:hypothetical protein Tco_0172768 [Tanacetum coccineum]
MRMLVKDTRSQDGKDDKDNDKGSKSRSQSMKEQAYNKEQRESPRPHELNDKSNLIDLIKECGQVGGQGTKVNAGVDGVPDFSTIIAQQLHNLLPTNLAQVGNQGRNQGNDRNQNGDAINDNIQGDVRNFIENNDQSVQDMNGCGKDQKVKYTAGSFVGKALTWWNSQIHTRS